MGTSCDLLTSRLLLWSNPYMGEDLPVSPARLAMQGTPHTPTLQRKLAGNPRMGGIWTARLGCDWPVSVARLSPGARLLNQRAVSVHLPQQDMYLWVP